MVISRRRFVAMLSGTALGTALGPLLLERRVNAQAAMGPVRFLAVRTPHGVDRDFWIPRTTGGAEPGSNDESLANLTFEYTGSILGALMPWRDQITILDGLDSRVTKENTRGNAYGKHGHGEQGTMLTGAQPPGARDGNYGEGHRSLDFYLHGQIPSPVLLTAAVEGSGTWKCMSYDANGRPRDPETSPRELFRSAFPSDWMPPDPTEPGVDYSTGERRIMTYNQMMLQSLEARLAGSERQKITDHIAGMTRFIPGGGGGGGLTGSCSVQGSEVPSEGGGVGDYTGVERVTRAHAEVIAQAFACGRARVATLQILNDFPNYYTQVPEVRAAGAEGIYGNDYRYHENLVHDYWNRDLPASTHTVLQNGFLAGLRWAATHFASILEVLDDIIDPLDPSGGSILDNTVVYWHNEFGHDGHDEQHTRHPVVIAGGGGRTLRLGRYLRLRDIRNNNTSNLVAHNKLLVSICHAMGMTDVNYFGDRDLEGRSEYSGPLMPLMA